MAVALKFHLPLGLHSTKMDLLLELWREYSIIKIYLNIYSFFLLLFCLFGYYFFPNPTATASAAAAAAVAAATAAAAAAVAAATAAAAAAVAATTAP